MIFKSATKNKIIVLKNLRTLEGFFLQNSRTIPRNGLESINYLLPKCHKLLPSIMFARFQSTNANDAEGLKKKPTDKIMNEKIVVSEGITRGEKLKKAIKQYGSTVIVFHIGISLLSLGTCYLLVSMGMDSTAVFTVLGLQEWASKSQIAASAGTFAVAYAIHKVFAPIRITITLASVPFIVRYMRKIGFLRN